MKRQLLKNLSVAAAVTLALASCEKEIPEVVSNHQDNNPSIITEGINKTPLVIDGKKMEWNFTLHKKNKSKSLSKGMIMNESIYYEEIIDSLKAEYGEYELIKTLKFTYHNQQYETKLLRIDRKSEPGKYFYVMIDNLNVKLDTACWVYGDNESNATKYGRLYTWNAANALAKEIGTKLPVYYKNNPTKKKMNSKKPVKAKLLSRQDICDIIECDAIEYAPEDGYTIDDQYDCPTHGRNNYQLYYYDVFVGGLEGNDDEIEFFRGERTLGGFRNTKQEPEWTWFEWVNGWYNKLNEWGRIWTRSTFSEEENESANYHSPLEIWVLDNHEDNNYYNYTAMFSSSHWNKYGFSVRYMFEPHYE